MFIFLVITCLAACGLAFMHMFDKPGLSLCWIVIAGICLIGMIAVVDWDSNSEPARVTVTPGPGVECHVDPEGSTNIFCNRTVEETQDA